MVCWSGVRNAFEGIVGKGEVFDPELLSSGATIANHILLKKIGNLGKVMGTEKKIAPLGLEE